MLGRHEKVSARYSDRDRNLKEHNFKNNQEAESVHYKKGEAGESQNSTPVTHFLLWQHYLNHSK